MVLYASSHAYYRTSLDLAPPHGPDHTAMATMRRAAAAAKGSITGPEARQPYDAILERTPTAPGVTFEAATVGGVPGWWCRPVHNRAPASAVLYLHGGAYILGTAYAHRHLVSQLVARSGVDFFSADYRLGPEHPFPAAVSDALAAYQGLVVLGRHQVALAGNSAGGGLALVVAAIATHLAASSPAALPPLAVLAFSPWTDLALASASMQTRAEADPVLTQASLASCAGLYLHGHDAQDPRASPVYGNLAAMPPTQGHVGDAEVLLDDSVRYVEQAQAAGAAASLHVWEGMPHVFVSNVQGFQAASQALDLSGEFLTTQLSK